MRENLLENDWLSGPQVMMTKNCFAIVFHQWRLLSRKLIINNIPKFRNKWSLRICRPQFSLIALNSFRTLLFRFKGPNVSPSQFSIKASSTQAQSSLLFSTSLSKDRQKMLKPVPSDFGSQKLMPSQGPMQELQGQLLVGHLWSARSIRISKNYRLTAWLIDYND